jgi:hypothetical protein
MLVYVVYGSFGWLQGPRAARFEIGSCVVAGGAVRGCERPKVRMRLTSDQKVPHSRHRSALSAYTKLRHWSCELHKFHNRHSLGVQSKVAVSQSFYSDYSFLR